MIRLIFMPDQRSIPACAGEPCKNCASALDLAVYPRVCGGTSSAPKRALSSPGLSPRVRGNHERESVRILWPGSIPACAGEPGRSGELRKVIRVYPRVCGGTAWSLLLARPAAGLSPRVRGNHDRKARGPAGQRSIPACAGEPSATTNYRAPHPVYPRVCGGTSEVSPGQPIFGGLSPRVRGNQIPDGTVIVKRGSIPACAGEPRPFATGNAEPRVYPRVCGGTSLSNPKVIGTNGLSPRVRGNLGPHRSGLSAPRSIPACAGEPPGMLRQGAFLVVYPRVCGGTGGRHARRRAARGLSPRVRGNRQHIKQTTCCQGSIPACAGEPNAFAVSDCDFGVYPRVCGGTRGRAA